MSSIDTTIARPRVEDAEITALREHLAGELFLPSDPGYAIATPWNVAVERTPRAVIAVCLWPNKKAY